MTAQRAKSAIEFPQGYILIMENQTAYFMPRIGTDAYVIWGEHKELFGKHAITVPKNRETGAGGYSVVYEFDDNGGLSDARLVNDTQIIRGKAVDAAEIEKTNHALGQGKVTLNGKPDENRNFVFNVAQFSDGRLLIQMMTNDLYLGTPGNYKKLDAHVICQGGNSMWYKMATGESIDLPYGYGGPKKGEVPMYNGEELTYKEVKTHKPEEFGLVVSAGKPHLDPFSPQLTGASKAVFQPPKP